MTTRIINADDLLVKIDERLKNLAEMKEISDNLELSDKSRFTIELYINDTKGALEWVVDTICELIG